MIRFTGSWATRRIAGTGLTRLPSVLFGLMAIFMLGLISAESQEVCRTIAMIRMSVYLIAFDSIFSWNLPKELF
jgi:hypothetical protein